MSKPFSSFLFVLVLMSFVLAACGGAATEAPAVEPTSAAAQPTESLQEDPMSIYAPYAVSGDIITAGSSTVFPLTERMKQRFEEEGFTGT